MEGDTQNNNQDAAFNMAIATLERLDTILQQIRTIDSNMSLPIIFRQSTKIKLLKQFFINASPLLDEKVVKQYKEEILNLQIDSKIGIKSGAHKVSEFYSPEKEKRVDTILIELQVSLRKYFMPSKKQAMF